MEINRDVYLSKLIQSKENGLIKVVTGLRRSGKSYLLKTLFKNQSAWRLPDVDKRKQEIRPLINVADSFRKIVVVGEPMKLRRDEHGIIEATDTSALTKKSRTFWYT